MTLVLTAVIITNGHPVKPDTVTEGTSFSLTCKGTGLDPAEMTVTSFWTLDGKSVNPTLITTTTVQTDAVSLN